MEPSAGVLSLLASPFPGLRAFDTDESLLFFGRETHTEALLRRLSESRFLAVVGSSGCGKSSLVRAGLLPALLRGYLVHATSRWRIALLRPGTAPIDALAAALAKAGIAGAQEAVKLRQTLGSTSGGLVEVVRRARLAPGESLLVIVDQFEEIFRYAHEGPDNEESQASLFVSQLLRAVESEVPIYVTLTMRSDYQGDCAQFAGLPEALNRSQYLVPRLTREQRREAIVRPLDLVDAAATPRLVNRLLNDLGDDPDQLPVLQHALLRTYRHWQDAGGRGDIDLPDYEAIGGIAHALGRHGDEILEEFSEDDRHLAEKVFRCLTSTERGRVIRRPKELGAVHRVVNATGEAARERVNAIVAAFSRRESSLLMLSAPALEPGTVVDITHESLMRKWPRLAGWIKEEARSVEWYSDLARDVVRYRTGGAGLWRDPELSEVLKRRDREGWNEAWALQCSQPGDPSFDEVQSFLGASVDAQEKERRREARRRWIVSLLSWLLLATIVTAGAVFFLLDRRQKGAIKNLRDQYLAVQNQYQEAQRETLQARARAEEAARQLSMADPDERDRLRRQFEALQRDYLDSQTKAKESQAQLDKLRQNQDLASSDYSALLKRVQNLQQQLDSVTAERDKLRYNRASSPQSSDPALSKQVDDLRVQLGTVTAERDKLRAVAREASNTRGVEPTFVALPENSILHLPAPFAGSIAVGVGEIHSQPTSHFRVYIWTTDGKAPLPEPFRTNEGRFESALRRHGLQDKPEEECRADGPGSLSCYRVQGGATIQGRQQPGSFTFRNVRYEILATGWNGSVSGSYQDSVSLAIYPAPQASAAN